MDSAASQDAESVRVIVRVRPRNEREEQAQSNVLHSLEVDGKKNEVYVCKRKIERGDIDRELRCTYDHVLGEKASQDDVFAHLHDSVQQIVQGYNCTIFAYGQTGTGKTHTMLGRNIEKNLDLGGADARSNWGVIPRAVETLFEELRAVSKHGAGAIVHCSYMQIYNNDVYDLLQENKARMKEPLPVREMVKGNGKQIYVSGVSEFRVTSLEETIKLLHLGGKNRAIRATEYNEKSSRSHALLQLSAEVETRGSGTTTIIRRAKLNLVDLAGSEKWDTDVSMGADRCKELTSINQSLSALGNVISALTNPKRTHIPYRDSKLTRLLQDSLGGNTRTVVIATISPSVSALEETISTLMFADRAKSIMVRVKVNEMVDDAVLLAQAQREIARLKVLLKQNATEKVSELEQRVTQLTAEKSELILENKKLNRIIASLRKERPQHTEPDSERTSARSTSRSVEKDKGSYELQLDKLRLDLVESGATATLHAKASVSVEQAGHEHKRLLQEIQSERRHLEEELGRLSGINTQQTPREEGDDERCPMCGELIDDHSDDALDLCIERESAAVALIAAAPPLPSGPPRSAPATGRLSSRNTSPRVVDSISVPPKSSNRPPSAQRPHPARKAPVRHPAAQSAAQTYGAPIVPSAQKNTKDRKNTAEPTEGLTKNNQAETEAPPVILRQGHKSVHALRKLHATSPYNHLRRKAAERKQQQPSQSSSSSPSEKSGVLHSVHDIGLNLMVYKFRYDCWYPCTIVGYDTKRKLHCCLYEYGDKQWQDLKERKVKVVGRAGEDD